MEHIRRLHWLRNEKKDLMERIQDLDYKIEELTNLSAAPISDMPKGNGVSNTAEITKENAKKMSMAELNALAKDNPDLFNKIFN